MFIKLLINWCFGNDFMIFGLSMVNFGWIVGVMNVSLFCVLVLVIIVFMFDLEFVVGKVKIVLIGVVLIIWCLLSIIF